MAKGKPIRAGRGVLKIGRITMPDKKLVKNNTRIEELVKQMIINSIRDEKQCRAL